MHPLTAALVSCNLRFVATDRSEREAWNVLADPTRRAILECLAAQPSAVGEIADRLPVSRPAVSQHLKVLKASGLVSEEAIGTRHVFRLDPAGVSALRDQLDTFWNRALANFEAALDDPDDPDDPVEDRP
jgi:DNA-binding transcriptional ArsR family regulator